MCSHARVYWRHLANTIEPSVCGGDAALCQFTLATCYQRQANFSYSFLLFLPINTVTENWKYICFGYHTRSLFHNNCLLYCGLVVFWFVHDVGLRLERSRVQLPAVPLSDNDLRQVVHTHVPLSPSSIIWYQSRGSDWEGNCRSGVALAMRHTLQWFIHLRAQGLSKGDDYPTKTPHRVWYSLRLPCSHPSS